MGDKKTSATCLHCSGECRLTDGVEVYPHRPDLYHKHFCACDPCKARVGCHDGTTTPLGHAANKPPRDARRMLHKRRLDPLWKGEPDKPSRRAARVRTYKFLAWALGIDSEQCHTGMFTIERCREAWVALRGQTPETIRQWNDARRTAAQEARSDRKRRKHGRPRRKASRDGAKSIRGPLFCPKQAALNEVPW